MGIYIIDISIKFLLSELIEYCFRPRRSTLYVPGFNEHYLGRARTLPADKVILDLGDPILVGAKIESRNNVVAVIK